LYGLKIDEKKPIHYAIVGFLIKNKGLIKTLNIYKKINIKNKKKSISL
jgi:hypothetical protein|tara:strand:- start:197 stop:340 length:144 start_codon:yes stop_codon:yes gene_type:complete